MIFLIDPTATIESGHKSLTSIIQGTLLKKLNSVPEIAVKNCGLVAIIISVLINKPNKNDVIPKLK